MKDFVKQWIGLGLLLLMLVKAWVIPLVCLDYELRKDYITKTFCVNKNRPKLNCNGKCYLAKKLAEAEKQQQRQAEQDYMASLLCQVIAMDNTIRFEPPVLTYFDRDLATYHYKSSFRDRQTIGSVFRPPLA